MRSVQVRREAGRLEGKWTEVGERHVFHRASTNAAPPGRAPVVLVHGLLVSSAYLVPAARILASDFPVLAPDLPGYGRSGKPRRVLSVKGLADALAAWARALRLPRCHYLANSFGCQVTADLAARHPGLVDRVVLTGPTVDPGARSPLRQAARWLRDAPREALPLHLVIAADALRAGPLRALATFRNMMRDRIEEKLPRIRAPVLVVCGARDPVAPRAWGEAAARLLPRGELRVVPGAPHALNYSAPLALARVVRPFLEGEDGGPIP